MPASVEAPTRPRRTGVAERDADRPIAREPPERDPGRCWRFAVCVGGAGATSLAYLVALAAARQSTGPVLVADTGGPSGGLAGLAGVEAPRSLPELASHLEAGAGLLDGLYATGRRASGCWLADQSSPRAGRTSSSKGSSRTRARRMV